MQTNAPVVSLGLVDLVLNAGIMGKLVLLLLLGVSIFCWAVIFAKYRTIKTAQAENGKFLGFFWQSKSMDEIFARVDQFARSPVAAVFRSGMKELRKLPSNGDPATAGLEVENVSRSLSRTANDEIAILEKHVTWLATTASAAPFIGLFGTVWGIMQAFRAIGTTGSTSIIAVAPGISEALVNTAAGLAAAIPALIFYNYFMGKVRQQRAGMEDFSLEFINLAERNFT